MPSAKQIKARKLFAKRVKRGDFRKAISKTKKAKLPQRITTKPKSSSKLTKKNQQQFNEYMKHQRNLAKGSREASAYGEL